MNLFTNNPETIDDRPPDGVDRRRLLQEWKYRDEDCAEAAATAGVMPRPLTAAGRAAKLRNSMRFCAVTCSVSFRLCNSATAPRAVACAASAVFASRAEMLVSSSTDISPADLHY